MLTFLILAALAATALIALVVAGIPLLTDAFEFVRGNRNPRSIFETRRAGLA